MLTQRLRLLILMALAFVFVRSFTFVAFVSSFLAASVVVISLSFARWSSVLFRSCILIVLSSQSIAFCSVSSSSSTNTFYSSSPHHHSTSYASAFFFCYGTPPIVPLVANFWLASLYHGVRYLFVARILPLVSFSFRVCNIPSSLINLYCPFNRCTSTSIS